MTDRTNSNDIGNYAEILGKLFSWPVITVISIIVSGTILEIAIPYKIDRDHFLGINTRFLKINVTGFGVTLGFTCLLFVFLFVASFFGPQAYALVKRNFGFDPGHPLSLYFLSGLISIVISVTIVALKFSGQEIAKWLNKRESDKYNKLIKGFVDGRKANVQ